jgi:hypothetical protein
MTVFPALLATMLAFAAFPTEAERHPLASALPSPDQVGQLFIDDMVIPNEVRPVKIDYSWTRKARVGSGNIIPEGWSHATMWGGIHEGRPGNRAKNVRVQVRDCALWVLSRKTGRWSLLQHSVAPEGAAFVEDYRGNINAPASTRTEADGSVSVRPEPGFSYHFWPSGGRAQVDPNDIAGMASVFFARLVVDDPALPDDRADAVLVGSAGGDYWRDAHAEWKADWSNNHDWAIGRIKRVTAEWQPFTGSTHGTGIENVEWTASAKARLPADFAAVLDETTLRTNPPPLRELAAQP